MSARSRTATPRRHLRIVSHARSATLAAAAAAMLSAPAAVAPAAAQELSAARVVPLQITGDPQARFSMVILGDGYTAAELPTFRSDVDRHLNILWSIEPFRSYRSYFNVYMVEVPSRDSGVTCDPDDARGPGQRNTAFGLHFQGGCTNPNARGVLVGRDSLVRAAARLATPHFNQILIIANTATYGGIGGALATTTGTNPISALITPHELGHSLGRLQDEYTYRERGVRGGFYSGDEPASVHHTLLTEEQMRAQQAKWWRWLGDESESGGTIGRYEGGMYNVAGVWRPSRHSMMISLGYYFDQVSRERMVARISTYTQLIAASTPTDQPVARDQVVWIETASPVYHELDVSWSINGRPVGGAAAAGAARPVAPAHARQIELASFGVRAGDSVSVRVIDPTPFVRDPAIRDSVLTATRSWVVSSATVRPASLPVVFSSSTATERPIGAESVVYVATLSPGNRILDVSWELNGRPLDVHPHARTLRVPATERGTHTLTASVTDPSAPTGGAETVRWTIDATPPRVSYALSEPAAVATRADGTRHYFMRDEFTMRLEASDDQEGHVVAEFRVNGDGWHHYYGWPDSPPGTPYRFTPRGTVIKELVYGSLSIEGLSPQPWEAREPGWGTHVIEYRAIDAAGNVSDAQAFHVTLMPTPLCTATVTGRHVGDLRAEGVTCLRGATVSGSVDVAPGAALFAAGSTIEGSLTAAGADVIELLDSTVRGSAELTATRVRALFGARIGGELIW
jgi:hypothetical protein